MIGDTYAPSGAPSLTAGEITQLYQQYLGRTPTAAEMASEQENALKYSAAGIERQISLRAGNVAGSGIRGDEGLPNLTVPRPAPVVLQSQVVGNNVPLGSVATMGAAGTLDTEQTVGPVGLSGPVPGRALPTGYDGSGINPGGMYTPAAIAQTGSSLVFYVLIGGAALAAYYFLRK